MAGYEVIVIGAGVEGSSTAYNLAKTGKKTLLLEQFPLPHTRGSSHGQSRIIRKAYTQSFYAEMMLEAYPMWGKLEEETNSKLYTNTGMLMIGKKGSESVVRTTEALVSVNCKHHHVPSHELKGRFPMLRFDETYEGVMDEEAGILHADKCVAKLQEMFVRYGGTLRDGEKVSDITPGRIVTVTTAKGTYQTDSLVITAGPWASQLTKPLGLHLPLKPVSILVCYWRVRKACPDPHTLESGLPSFAFYQRILRCHTYGMPSHEYPGLVKICFHGGPPIDPDDRDAHPDTAWDVEEMKAFVKEHFPNLEHYPSITERCIYTMTPDEDFILDTHPVWKNIVIGAGFSGHGFKLAPVVGKILAQIATGQKPSYEMSHFRINRFCDKAKL